MKKQSQRHQGEGTFGPVFFSFLCPILFDKVPERWHRGAIGALKEDTTVEAILNKPPPLPRLQLLGRRRYVYVSSRFHVSDKQVRRLLR